MTSTTDLFITSLMKSIVQQSTENRSSTIRISVVTEVNEPIQNAIITCVFNFTNPSIRIALQGATNEKGEFSSDCYLDWERVLNEPAQYLVTAEKMIKGQKWRQQQAGIFVKKLSSSSNNFQIRFVVMENKDEVN